MSLIGFINKERRNWAAKDEPTMIGRVWNLFRALLRHYGLTIQKSRRRNMSKVFYYSAIIMAFRGKSVEASTQTVFANIFERYTSSLGEWVHTMKTMILFHTAIQEPTTAKFIAIELKKREESLYSYAKKYDDSSYDSTNHYETGKRYLRYVKEMVNSVLLSDVMFCRAQEISSKIASSTTETLLSLYQKLECAMIAANEMFVDSLFCSKFRIYKWMFSMLYKDVEKNNKLMLTLLSVLKGRISSTDIANAKKICLCYANYIEVTKDLKEKIMLMLSSMKFGMISVKYFEGGADDVKLMKEQVDAMIEQQRVKDGSMPYCKCESSGSEYSVEEDDMFKENGSNNKKRPMMSQSKGVLTDATNAFYLHQATVGTNAIIGDLFE